MPEMPIDPEFGRFIEGLQMTPDGGAEVMLEDDVPEVEELEDGSAVVTIDKTTGPEESTDFYENLAETLDISELNTIASRYLDLIEKDKEARKERDKQYEDGLRRTGLGNDSPGGATFMGASKVVHPVMAEACVDFAARAIKELFPPDGPTRTNILGESTEQKSEIAERKRDYMNWQLTEQIEEFRDEQEQLLAQLPLGGSQFLKMWWDDQKKRPCAEFVPIDNVYLPFSAVNFYTAQRVTEVHNISEWEFKNRIDRGLYRDVDLIRATMEPDPTAAEKANNKIEGKQWQEGEDGIRRVFHIYTWLNLDDDKHSKGENAPYILMVDELDREVLGLYRNWEDGDDTLTKLDWLIEFKFIPWRGAYAIGLPHLIGNLSAALTGTLRALLDSAHINNAPTLLKLKGARISGQSQQVDVTQVVEIEGAPGVDDVKKIAMPMPFNPPSPVLFQLMGFLQTAAKGVVTTSEEKIADITSQAPVGTTQALIEQGAAVFSAIHARLHNSQKRVLMVLQRLNRWYLDDQKKGDIVAELPIKRDDFKRNSDVIPVSDPHIFSETQRMAQTQAVMSYMEKFPQLFDARVVVGRALKQMKIPNIQELMPQYSKPIEMHAADENAAMALGRMAVAYPRQDHMAHILSHLAFANDPALGMNPIVAPMFIPQVLQHIKQHMMLWYTQKMNQYTLVRAGMKPQKYEDSKLAPEIDRAMAAAAGHMAMDTQQNFASILPQIQQLAQMAQQLTQPKAPPMDGEAQAVLQASMAETQRRAARDQADVQLKKEQMALDVGEQRRKEQFEALMNTEDNLTEERMKTLDLTLEAAKIRKEQEQSVTDLQNTLQRGLNRGV
jgi:chaperonin GroES